MNSGVSATGTQGGDWHGAQTLECRLQYALDGALLRLPLPSAEFGPVIVQHELHGAFGHCGKLSGQGGVSSNLEAASREFAVTKPIDFARPTRSHFALNVACAAFRARAPSRSPDAAAHARL